MSSQRQLVTTRDLVEETKKRIVILSICVVGLSYIMSLTSTSVWVNLPAAAVLVILFRYFALDFEMRRKEAVYNGRTSGNVVIQEKPLDAPKAAVKNNYWRKKVNSPPVEEAIDQLTRHVVSEWVTDLWYSKLTPDRDGPEELVQLMNGVLGEIAYRLRNINLIDLLMRDVIHMVCKHLEVFRICQAKVKKNLASLSLDQRDMELKLVLAAENKLHPLLFSAEAEHKVLQHIMDGLLSLTFQPEDLQCSFFRYVSRELLACAVIRPVLNLANPRFINERIEQVVVSTRKGNGEAATENKSSLPKQNGDTSDLSPFPDPSASGVELVELKNAKSMDKLDGEKLGCKDASKDPLLSVDTRSTRSWSSLPLASAAASDGHIDRSTSGGEWGDMLDYFSRRKTRALAPEHFENLWSKGRNYNSKDAQAANNAHQNASARRTDAVNSSIVVAKQKESGLKNASVERGVNHPVSNTRPQSETMYIHADSSTLTPPPLTSDEDDEEPTLMSFDETESASSSQSSSGDEENRVTGLDSPTTKVWDGRTNRNSGVSHIRHPLEGLEGKKGKRANKGKEKRLHRQKSGRKRSRLASQKGLLWQEVERTSFLSGIGQDIHPLKPNIKDDDSSDDYDMETIGRLQSGTTASSSASSLPGSFTSTVNSPQTAFLGDTFFKLRCEVLGANIVTSSSKAFAVYSISVTDAERNSWSIKRRYRHFEELHRRLKEYSEYKLHLPPKHFLSTGLDVPIIQERCKLLDQYLKKLMQLPTISGSIDVWDFLSIDSQTYTFSSAFSIIETFSVRHLENSANVSCLGGPKINHLQPRRGHAEHENKDQPSGSNHSSINSIGNKPVKDYGKVLESSGGNSDNRIQNKTSLENFGRKGNEIIGDPQQKSESLLEAADDSTFPVEWVPPNLSGPILDLVDVVFQLQEGAWIRRKAFWVAKQVLQLGMGDALDDWLVEKIQRLRRGATVASGIKRIEQILWPDGIFITKHPSRQRPPASASASESQHPDQLSSPKAENVENIAELHEKEAGRRAKFVYELMIDNAPATVVSIVGRKEYEQCAKDLYYFLQSTVCLKQLVMDLLQLVLLYAFPELDHIFKQLHEEKQKFGEFKAT